MPSPLGHTVISSSICLFFKRDFSFRRDWKVLVFCIVVGLLPDADLLFVLLANNTGIHRSVTHNFPFLIVITVVISLFYKKIRIFNFPKTLLLVFCLLAVHLIMDFFTLDEILHFGINFFYPFTNNYIPAPFYLFMGFDWRQPSVLFSFYMGQVLLREFLITVPLLLAAVALRRRPGV